ncbi:MAG: S-layer homology domain-containing protein [Caryophanon sp.]|nr:S-layer homology domain-containing protein [Caryophanon sp.]
MNKRNQFVATAATAVLAASVVAVPTTEAAQIFPDVPTTHGHYDTINELAERGIVKGFPDGTFKPGQSVTRGQAAKMIAGILGLDTTNVKNPNFKDIKTDFQYYGAIAALVDEGIIDGYEDGTYRPDATLTRGHMAKILNRAFKLTADTTPAPFTDIATSEYKNDIEALYDNKVTVGTTATTYSPRQNVTRGQLASFIIRAEDAVAFELVEVKGTISKIENGVVTIDGVEYTADAKWAAFFGADNAAALVGAEVVLTVQKSKDGNVIKAVKSVKLTKPNTTFDAKGLAVDTIEIAADGITLKNADAKEVKVADKVNAKIENSNIGTLTLGVDAKAAFSGTNKVDKIALPKGVNPANVITGLPNVADIPVTEYEPPTTPVDPPSGGGGGWTPPTTPVKNYEADLESIIPVVEGTEQFAQYQSILSKYADVDYSYTATGGGSITVDVDDTVTLQQLRVGLATEAQGGLGLTAFAQDVVRQLSDDQLAAIDAVTSVTVKSKEISAATINVPANKTSEEAINQVVADVKAAAVAAYDEVGAETKAIEVGPVDVIITFSNSTTLTYTVTVK